MTKTDNRRGCIRNDAKWLRRARARFTNRLRPWAELATDPVVFRERTYAIGEAMVKHGLLASASGNNAAMSVLGCWARRDGVSWWAFRHRDVRYEVAAKLNGDFRRWVQMRERTA